MTHESTYAAHHLGIGPDDRRPREDGAPASQSRIALEVVQRARPQGAALRVPLQNGKLRIPEREAVITSERPS